MPKPKRRTTSSALLGDAPARSSLIIDGGAAAAASPPEPQLAAAATPFAAASAIAGHPPGMDPQEANAAIEELSELQARDPEAFAELMQAALSGEGADDKVGELWEKAKQGKAPAPAGAPAAMSTETISLAAVVSPACLQAKWSAENPLPILCTSTRAPRDMR